MQNKKLAAIGDSNSISAFKAVGIDVFGVEDVSKIEELLNKLIKLDYGVIFITDDLAEVASQQILKYKSQTYPIILPIPSTSGSTGFGTKGLKHNIEKAIGMDIVFNKEGNK